MVRMTSVIANQCGGNAKPAAAVVSAMARMIPGNPNHSGGNAKPATTVASALTRIDLRELYACDNIAQQICAILSCT